MCLTPFLKNFVFVVFNLRPHLLQYILKLFERMITKVMFSELKDMTRAITTVMFSELKDITRAITKAMFSKLKDITRAIQSMLQAHAWSLALDEVA